MSSSDDGGQESLHGFLKELSEAVDWPDLVLILAIPLLLSVVFFFPRPIQNGLYLDYGNPLLLTFWGSSFVHRGVNHLLNNLVAYCLVISIVYLLLAFARKQRLFRYTMISFLLVVPPLIALANIVFIGRGTGAGFSGIGSAFFGFLLLSIFVFVRSRISNEIETSYSVVLFLIVAGIIAIIYDQTEIGAFILLLSSILVTIYVYRVGFDELKTAGSKLMSNPGYLLLVLLATHLSLASPFLLFPQEITSDGTTVNILSHYVGLVLGYFGPTVFTTYR